MIFELSEDQIKKVKEWNDPEIGHDCKYKPKHGMPKYSGAIGGSLQYIFCPTSIGEFVTVKCGCGCELDITEGM